MEKSVSGLQDALYRDLAEDYELLQMQSTLYRFFWQEGMEELLQNSLPLLLSKAPDQSLSELLERDFPDFLPEGGLCPKNGMQIMRQLGREMAKHQPEAQRLLLRPYKKGMSIWEELWLNDAGYQAGLITDTAYYLWLIEYLAAHGACYKENIKRRNKDPLNGHRWLLRLLQKAPPRLDKETGKPMDPGYMFIKRGGERIYTFVLAQVERDLRRMADLLREEHAAGRTEITSRLSGLTVPVRMADGKARPVDYLPWLTERLKRMALHITIKNWLQYSGHPLVVQDEAKREKKKGGRKNDFSMRLLDSFCGSPEGYEFRRKIPGGAADWQIDLSGFCILAQEQIEPLLESLREKTYFYVPLAVDLYSGCTFFLAGKENYEEAYETAGKEARKAYKEAKQTFCFDYLRLEPYPVNLAGAYRLMPTFHETAGKSYTAVMELFKRYCMTERSSPRRLLQQLNGSEPDGVPAPFSKAFE